MKKQETKLIDDFILVGINHWQASVSQREKFALSRAGKSPFLDEAREKGLTDVIVLSTCNRTEVLARAADAGLLTDLLVAHTRGTREEFNESGFVKKGEEAVRHFFRVSVGLDAQILGDLQIIKQVKEAFELAAGKEMVDSLLHRLMQFIFRAHKRSRSETELATGAATTAYAAVQFAKKRLRSLKNKKIVLVGTGKIGKITCKNLISLGADCLTLINRNPDRAELLGTRFGLETAPFESLDTVVADADLVIVATGAGTPVITAGHVDCNVRNSSGSPPKKRVLLDLSVPRNIDPQVGRIPGVELVNMDMLRETTDEAYQKRKKNVPLVEAIIEEELGEYCRWLAGQKVVPTIVALNEKLEKIRKDELDRFRTRYPDLDMNGIDHLTRRIINKIAAHPIDHLKENHDTDDFSEAVRSLFRLGKNGRNGRNGSSS